MHTGGDIDTSRQDPPTAFQLGAISRSRNLSTAPRAASVCRTFHSRRLVPRGKFLINLRAGHSPSPRPIEGNSSFLSLAKPSAFPRSRTVLTCQTAKKATASKHESNYAFSFATLLQDSGRGPDSTRRCTARIFNTSLPQMLDRRFKLIFGPGKRVSHAVLKFPSLLQVMKDTIDCAVLVERMLTVVQASCRRLTRPDFAALLLEKLCGSVNEQMLFCFRVLDIYDKGVLDYITLHSWLQSDAEPLLRNDLLEVCAAFKELSAPKSTGRTALPWGNSKYSLCGYKKASELGDLGLWGYACQKAARVSRNSGSQFHTMQQRSKMRSFRRGNCSGRGLTGRKESAEKICEEFIAIPSDETLSFEQFRAIKFSQKGLPDTLFLAIQSVFGLRICDAYCHFLEGREYRIYTSRAYGAILKRLYYFSPTKLQQLKYR